MNYCPLCRAELVTKTMKDSRSQRCPECDFTNWDNPVPVATGVLFRGEKIVIVKSRTRGDQWGLPSGFVEVHERAEDALVREVKEETNLEVSVLGALGTYPIDTGRKKILLIAYETIVEDGRATPGSEILEIDEVSPEAALKLLKGREERMIVETWLERRAKAT
mgnify:CR=1 FL=1